MGIGCDNLGDILTPKVKHWISLSGGGCSKLTTSLVDISLNFQVEVTTA